MSFACLAAGVWFGGSNLIKNITCSRCLGSPRYALSVNSEAMGKLPYVAIFASALLLEGPLAIFAYLHYVLDIGMKAPAAEYVLVYKYEF